MAAEIRQGRREDAAFLAGVMLAASRAHLARGPWDVILGGSEAECREYLRRLALAEPPSLCHYASFLVAEVDGRPAAALSRYHIPSGGWALVGAAMAQVQRQLGWTEAAAAAARQRAGPVVACTPPEIGADWGIENVAARPEHRRQGLVQMLLAAACKEAAAQCGRLAQIVTAIGNGPAVAAYQRGGFTLRDETRCAGFAALFGSPGLVRLVRKL